MPAPGAKTARAVEQHFVELARSVFGRDLVSIVLYGSYLRETFTPGVSDVNVLVILSQNRPEALRELGQRGRRLMRRNRITPLVLSRREFARSADVFPMEYMDIVDTHKVLVGPDVTGELELSRGNLRHEVEHQLRGSLVSLRQLAVAAGRRRPLRAMLLRRELERWYGSLAAILRGLLRLKGISPIPQTASELVSAVNSAVGLEPGPILQLLSGRGGAGRDSVVLLDGIVGRLSQLVEIVDDLADSTDPEGT